jgi:hypothetical protein
MMTTTRTPPTHPHELQLRQSDLQSNSFMYVGLRRRCRSWLYNVFRFKILPNLRCCFGPVNCIYPIIYHEPPDDCARSTSIATLIHINVTGLAFKFKAKYYVATTHERLLELLHATTYTYVRLGAIVDRMGKIARQPSTVRLERQLRSCREVNALSRASALSSGRGRQSSNRAHASRICVDFISTVPESLLPLRCGSHSTCL